MVIMSTENMSLPRYHVAGALLALNALLSPFAACAGFGREFPPRSSYEDRMREFDHSNLESGLLGPVVLKSAKPR